MRSGAYQVFLDSAIAIGTLGAVVAAIYGERIKNYLHPVKVTLELNDGPGVITRNSSYDRLVLWHHLRVRNQSPDTVVRFCRVVLVGIERLDDGRFRKLPFPVPFQFPWAPAGHHPPEITLVHDAVVDFGQLIPRTVDETEATHPGFGPTLVAFPLHFDGMVQAGDVCRFTLEVHAENLPRPPRFIFEVSWDGTWIADAEAMRQHLIIRPVRAVQVGD